MTYHRVFPESWSDVLRCDGIWRTDPRNNVVTIYRFCSDLRVMTATVPTGRLLDTVSTWFIPSETRVDDGRAVFGFVFGKFGFDPPHLIAEWPSLTRGTVTDRFWSQGRVTGGSLSWEFSQWTGRRRPQGFRPPAVPEQSRFHTVDGW